MKRFTLALAALFLLTLPATGQVLTPGVGLVVRQGDRITYGAQARAGGCPPVGYLNIAADPYRAAAVPLGEKWPHGLEVESPDRLIAELMANGMPEGEARQTVAARLARYRSWYDTFLRRYGGVGACLFGGTTGAEPHTGTLTGQVEELCRAGRVGAAIVGTPVTYTCVLDDNGLEVNDLGKVAAVAERVAASYKAMVTGGGGGGGGGGPAPPEELCSPGWKCEPLPAEYLPPEAQKSRGWTIRVARPELRRPLDCWQLKPAVFRAVVLEYVDSARCLGETVDPLPPVPPVDPPVEPEPPTEPPQPPDPVDPEPGNGCAAARILTDAALEAERASCGGGGAP